MKSKKINRPLKSLLLLLFAVLFLFGCSKQTSENSAPISRDIVPPPVDTNDVRVAPVENTDQISKENFDQIKNGMMLLDVEKIILGNMRKVTSKNDDGVLKETYRWETKDGSKYIEVSVEDEKVVGKNQKGLK